MIPTPVGQRNGLLARRMTFADLVAREPLLGKLLAAARAIKDTGTEPYFCANERFFGYGGHPGLKARLCWLVGWERRLGTADGGDALLRTPEAYELAYRTVYGALPGCRGACGCL